MIALSFKLYACRNGAHGDDTHNDHGNADAVGDCDDNDAYDAYDAYAASADGADHDAVTAVDSWQ